MGKSFLLEFWGWGKEDEERAPNTFLPLVHSATSSVWQSEPFHLILISHPVSSPAIPPMHILCSHSERSSNFWNAMLFYDSVPLHMLCCLLSMLFPLPFLASLLYRWLHLLSESFPSPAVALATLSPHPHSTLHSPRQKAYMCIYSACLWSH